jgi:hypothetical protein
LKALFSPKSHESEPSKDGDRGVGFERILMREDGEKELKREDIDI